ncbi:hypothetical protein AJ79_05790 [Helicocarpus griseus UAMH5409]|uniref:CENP-V/GFA domain-containing protein n=1 Tax=Helicocarpus griseus UAMH5409 TaxID=1447875 RepID=A0A2B7XJ83_9EURO|nr:hypothetical protein AJ79_05790 [Helicocarpus griseus UAMH5409]
MSTATTATENPGTPALTGSCLCSHIRYSVSTLPASISHCFCTQCRKAAGAPFQTYVTFPTATITWLNGGREPTYVNSSSFARRGFCDKCGSSLVFQMKAEPGRMSLAGGSIDDESLEKQKGEWKRLGREAVFYWIKEKPAWFEVPSYGGKKFWTDPDVEEQPEGWRGE